MIRKNSLRIIIGFMMFTHGIIVCMMQKPTIEVESLVHSSDKVPSLVKLCCQSAVSSLSSIQHFTLDIVHWLEGIADGGSIDAQGCQNLYSWIALNACLEKAPAIKGDYFYCNPQKPLVCIVDSKINKICICDMKNYKITTLKKKKPIIADSDTVFWDRTGKYLILQDRPTHSNRGSRITIRDVTTMKRIKSHRIKGTCLDYSINPDIVAVVPHNAENDVVFYDLAKGKAVNTIKKIDTKSFAINPRSSTIFAYNLLRDTEGLSREMLQVYSKEKEKEKNLLQTGNVDNAQFSTCGNYVVARNKSNKNWLLVGNIEQGIFELASFNNTIKQVIMGDSSLCKVIEVTEQKSIVNLRTRHSSLIESTKEIEGIKFLSDISTALLKAVAVVIKDKTDIAFTTVDDVCIKTCTVRYPTDAIQFSKVNNYLIARHSLNHCVQSIISPDPTNHCLTTVNGADKIDISPDGSHALIIKTDSCGDQYVQLAPLVIPKKLAELSLLDLCKKVAQLNAKSK